MMTTCQKCGKGRLSGIDVPTHICKGEKMSATKHDQGKPDLTFIRLDAIAPIAKVFEFGSRKYSRGNYLAGMSHNRILAAAARHLFAYIGGEDLDPESSESHLAHLGCCVHMLLTYKANGLGTDDRDLPPNLTNENK